MPAPQEGNATLPSDGSTNPKFFMGGWVQSLRAGVGGFLAFRASPAGSMVTLNEKGVRTHFTAAPTAAATIIRAANANRKTAVFVNNGAATIYLGKDATVTTATGTPIPQGGVWDDSDGTEDWYGITASGTADIRGWETV